MVTGRPLKFKTPEELKSRIDSYFDHCNENEKIPTITGLAVYLDTSRETLCDYKEREDFSDSIKEALQKCEQAIEYGAMTGKLNPTFCIFNLKNNYRWKDRTETDITTNGKDLHETENIDTDAITMEVVKRLKDQKTA
jgi:hypothetical protein